MKRKGLVNCYANMLALAILFSPWAETPSLAAQTEAKPTQETTAVTDNPQVTLAPAHEASGNVVIDVAFGASGKINVHNTPYWVYFAVGAVSMPMALFIPGYIFGVLLPVVGPPANLVFNSNQEKVVRAMTDVPLPAAIAASLKNQLSNAHPQSPTHFSIFVSDYGLVPRSGKAPEALSPGEPMCLTVEAVLRIAQEGSQDREDRLAVGLVDKSHDAPPPLCAQLSRLAENDGTLMRESIREVAEILAAMALKRASLKP